MNNQTAEVVLDFDELEKSFNSSAEALRKALGVGGSSKPEEVEEPLNKAKAESKMDYKDEAEESDEDEEEPDGDEDDDEEEEDMDKSMSIEEQLALEPEAEAAMDVAPFLKHLVKAFDRRFESMQKSLGSVTTLAKSIGNAQLYQMELQKSQADTVNRIAKEDQRTSGLRRLQKSRFDNGGDPIEVSGPEVLQKSTEWVREKKINLNEAGMIELRVNKGVLGKRNDELDQKVAKLMKEAS